MSKSEKVKPKSADDRRASAEHRVSERRKPVKKQTPALLQTSTVSILDKEELMEHCANGTLAPGHLFRITDNDGTHADFEVGSRGESRIYTYLNNSNAPEFAAYSGIKGIFIFPQFPLMDNFVSKMDGPAAELQGMIVDYLRENLSDDELRLLAGQLPKEKPSLNLGPMFAGTPGLYGIEDKVGFRVFDDGNLKVVFVSRELKGDEWSALHGVFLPVWKLTKEVANFKAFNESFDEFSDKKTLSLALGKKLLEIAEAAGITIKTVEKKAVEKEVVESNSDMGKLFACIDDRYSVEDGKVGIRAFSGSGDIAVIYVQNGYKGPWENLYHTRVNIADLASDAEKFKAFDVVVTKESDSEQKSLALGKLLLALAVSGNHEIKAPVKKLAYVGNTDMVNFWGKATGNMLEAFNTAVNAEYTENKSVDIRIGSNPDEGMVMAVAVSKAGFTLTPVMIGSRHPLSGKVEAGCYIFAEGQLPTKEMAESMGGKWKASVLPLVTYLIDEADGRKIIDPLSAGQKALNEKRAAEKKSKAERHAKQAKIMKVVAQDGSIVAPQYGKQPTLDRKPIATKPAPSTPEPVAQQNNAIDPAILAMLTKDMSPTEKAEFARAYFGSGTKLA